MLKEVGPVFLSGLIIFLAGVIMGGSGIEIASAVAVTGMVVYFAGGLLRAYSN